ncbi:hypothetical protein BC834DRAFT_626351 [Gloeopeniophorella convolvens]|nr:hypothetical protein BC834DRAFT_626351 [Gloeopeniophorella convolvens]
MDGKWVRLGCEAKKECATWVLYAEAHDNGLDKIVLAKTQCLQIQTSQTVFLRCHLNTAVATASIKHSGGAIRSQGHGPRRAPERKDSQHDRACRGPRARSRSCDPQQYSRRLLLSSPCDRTPGAPSTATSRSFGSTTQIESRSREHWPAWTSSSPPWLGGGMASRAWSLRQRRTPTLGSSCGPSSGA